MPNTNHKNPSFVKKQLCFSLFYFLQLPFSSFLLFFFSVIHFLPTCSISDFSTNWDKGRMKDKKKREKNKVLSTALPDFPKRIRFIYDSHVVCHFELVLFLLSRDRWGGLLLKIPGSSKLFLKSFISGIQFLWFMDWESLCFSLNALLWLIFFWPQLLGSHRSRLHCARTPSVTVYSFFTFCFSRLKCTYEVGLGDMA